MKRIILLVLLGVCGYVCGAEWTLAPVVNLNDATDSSNPQDMKVVGDLIYLTATDGIHGRELFKVDSGGNSTLLADIFAGPKDSNPGIIGGEPGKVFFSAEAAATGRELYVTDGTPGGTKLLKDIRPGSNSGFPGVYALFQGVLFFAADDGTHGDQVWRSDGTEQGTDVFYPGGFDNVYSFAAGSSLFYFVASDRTRGRTVWVTDGSVSGTIPLHSYNPYYGAVPEQLTTSGDTLYFYAVDDAGVNGLWESNGTPEGTVLLQTFTAELSSLVISNGELYFATTPFSDSEVNAIWKSDGTPEGTVHVVDTPRTQVSLYPFKGYLYFSNFDEAHGGELWRTDGTAAGTEGFDLTPGTTGTNPVHFTATPDLLYFQGGKNLWVTDGNSGAHILLNLSSVPSGDTFTPYGQDLLLGLGDNAHGVELYRTDGTSAGTRLFSDINRKNSSSSPYLLTPFHSGVSFAARAEDGAGVYFARAGSDSATRLMALPPPSGPINMFNQYASLNRLFIAPGSGTALWVSDGSPAGTMPLADIGGYIVRNFETVNSRVLFMVQTGSGQVTLASTDGTAGNAQPLLSFPPPDGDSFTFIVQSAVLHGLEIFTGGSAQTGAELFVTDGTVPGTRLLKDIEPGTAGIRVDGIAAGATVAYFFFYTDSNRAELWKTDGTAANTVPVRTFSPRSAATAFHCVGDRLFFSLVQPDSPSGLEPWVSDGTQQGTFQLRDINSGIESSGVDQYTTLGDTVVFVATEPAHGQELWVSDGTTAGTKLLRDIYVGAESSNISPISLFEGRAYFLATNDGSNFQLWSTDGTHAGTVQVAANPMLKSYDTRAFVQNDGTFYFSGVSDAFGSELWAASFVSSGEGEGEGDGESRQYTTDEDGDHQISLAELLRVIQLFNTGALHCEPGTEDGYAPGAGDESCGTYAADYDPADWRINLSELLRVVQFHNSGGYHFCAGGEGGFCSGPG